MNNREIVTTDPYLVSQSQMGTKEILSIIIRRKWIILGVLLPIVLVAILATLQTSSTVTASSRVILETHRPENPKFGVERIDYAVLMSTASQVVISIPVANLAAEALMDSLPTLQETVPEFALVTTQEELRDILMGSEDCNQVGETNILEISVTHPNPRFAMMGVSALTDSYEDYNITLQRNEPAVQYYTDQIDNVMAELDSLNAVRSEILTDFGLIAFDRSAASNTAQIVEMERQYFTAQATRKSLEAMLTHLKSTVNSESRFLPHSEDMESQELYVLKRMLDEEETHLTKLRQQYQDNSEWVKRQEAVVAELETKFIMARDNMVKDIEIQLDIAQAKEDAFASSIEEQKQRAARFPEVQHLLAGVDVKIESQMDLLELLQTKRGEVRMQAASDYRISNIVRLNEPSISGFVGSGKKAIYLIMATIFGLVLGLIVALFLDNQDHRIYNKFEVQEHLEIPVLGSISKAQE